MVLWVRIRPRDASMSFRGEVLYDGKARRRPAASVCEIVPSLEVALATRRLVVAQNKFRARPLDDTV